MNIASWVAFKRFLNSVPTVSKKAYIAYCAEVRSLMTAYQNGHVEVVNRLLEHGASVDLQDKVNIIQGHNF